MIMSSDFHINPPSAASSSSPSLSGGSSSFASSSSPSHDFASPNTASFSSPLHSFSSSPSPFPPPGSSSSASSGVRVGSPAYASSWHQPSTHAASPHTERTIGGFDGSVSAFPLDEDAHTYPSSEGERATQDAGQNRLDVQPHHADSGQGGGGGGIGKRETLEGLRKELNVGAVTDEELLRIEIDVTRWLVDSKYRMTAEEKKPFFRSANLSLISGLAAGVLTNACFKRLVPLQRRRCPAWVPTIFVSFYTAQVTMRKMRKKVYAQALLMDSPVGDRARTSLLHIRTGRSPPPTGYLSTAVPYYYHSPAMGPADAAMSTAIGDSGSGLPASPPAHLYASASSFALPRTLKTAEGELSNAVPSVTPTFLSDATKDGENNSERTQDRLVDAWSTSAEEPYGSAHPPLDRQAHEGSSSSSSSSKLSAPAAAPQYKTWDDVRRDAKYGYE